MKSLFFRPGKLIGVLGSVDNRKLWVSGIPKNKSADEIKAGKMLSPLFFLRNQILREITFSEMSKLTDGVTLVHLYSHPIDKSKTRGYAFVEYESHRAAALARRKLVPGNHVTQTLREIKFGVLKLPFFGILGPLNVVNLVDFSLQIVQNFIKRQNSEML